MLFELLEINSVKEKAPKCIVSSLEQNFLHTFFLNLKSKRYITGVIFLINCDKLYECELVYFQNIFFRKVAFLN